MKIKLTEEEIKILQNCLNDDTEIPLEILQKLNPSFFEKLAQDSKFDFEKLNRFKIPTIEYAGKRSESTILASATLVGQSSPLQVERMFSGGKIKTNDQLQAKLFDDKDNNGKMDEEDDWYNMIVQGDNLQFLKTCYLNQDPLIKDKVKGQIKLIYIDPPFGTGDEYGGSEGAISYSAKIAGAEYIEAIRERLIFLRELLHSEGNIFVRIDYHFGHSIKLLMDEVFGSDNFNNEIIINRFKRQLRGLKQFNVSNDVLLFYSKTKGGNYFQEVMRSRLCSFCGSEREPSWIPMSSPGVRRPPDRIILGTKMLPPKGRHWTFRQETINIMEKEGRIKIVEPGKYTDIEGNSITGVPYYLQTDDSPTDADWTDLRGYVRTSRYPTENPEELLERVIQCASQEGDIVMDCFGGSGTTGAVAEKLGRRWIMCDFGKHAIYTMQKRLLTIEESKGLGKDVKKGAKYAKEARPFIVASVGAFDFSKIIDLRKHKEAYISFALALHGITKKDTSKYSAMSNIYGVKEENPVEVYPIWQDEYLKEIKIDKDYLKGIIDSTGSKLRGDYYIVAPETCDVIGDTTLKTDKGGKVNFKLLTFPYKILEELSRQYQLSEQPSNSDDINNLISSTRFYFNEEVEIEIVKHKDGLQIKSFNTNIVDGSGNKFENLDGLAMVLIDKNWDGEAFTMEEAIYLKNIPHDKDKEDYGVIKVDGLTDKVALIAIDKHGNESKLIIHNR